MDPVIALSTIAVDRIPDRVQQVLLTKRLAEELYGSSLHRLDCHGDVAVASDENDGQMNIGLFELALQVEAASSGDSHIEHDASRHIRQRGTYEILRRRECPYAKAFRTNQAAEPFADARVVIDDIHHRQIFFGHLRLPAEVATRNGRSLHALHWRWPTASRNAPAGKAHAGTAPPPIPGKGVGTPGDCVQPDEFGCPERAVVCSEVPGWND